jgi:hypothetical protein
LRLEKEAVDKENALESLQASNGTIEALEATMQELKMQNRSLVNQVLGLENSLKELSLSKTVEIESLESDLHQYKARHSQY